MHQKGCIGTLCFLLLAACSSNPDKLPPGVGHGLVTMDPSSTLAFTPDNITLTSSSCGSPGNLYITVREPGNSGQTLSIALDGSILPAINQAYQTSAGLLDDPKVTIDSYRSENGRLVHSSQDDNSFGVQSASVRFSQVGNKQGNDVTAVFSLRLNSGSVLAGTIAGTVAEDATGCTGSSTLQKVEGYDFAGNHTICWKSNTPEACPGKSRSDAGFLARCGQQGFTLLSCDTCNAYQLCSGNPTL